MSKEQELKMITKKILKNILRKLNKFMLKQDTIQNIKI